MVKKLKTILINLPVAFIEDDERQPPGGLISIATYARMKGFDISVCDLSGMDEREAIDSIGEADIYGVGTYTPNYKLAQDTVMALKKKYPKSICVAGGPHATALPEKVAHDFDIVVCGEGEEAFSGLLCSIQRAETWPKIIRAEPIGDLDSLPFPDYYSFCNMKKYTRRINEVPVMCLDSSRGCNFKCRFCNSTVSKRGHWRKRSTENVFREIMWHYDKGWRAFRFNDDNFLADRSRAIEICGLIEPLKIQWRIFARVEALDEELCKILLSAGCVHISVGIESLSPEMLRRMGKTTSVEKIINGLSNARKAGIITRGFFIVGFPGETDATIDLTIQTIKGLHLDEATVYPCIAYPGTDLYERPEFYNIKWIDHDYSKYVQIGKENLTGYVIETHQFGPEKIEEWRTALIDALDASRISWCDVNKTIV